VALQNGVVITSNWSGGSTPAVEKRAENGATVINRQTACVDAYTESKCVVRMVARIQMELLIRLLQIIYYDIYPLLFPKPVRH
jgi:hypothetical protein